MNEEDLKPFLKDKIWVHIRLKSGYHYKAQIMQLGEDSLVILDKLGLTSIFTYDSIESVTVWKKKINSE